MVIQESAENYLEQILMIQLEKGSVRSIDIAEALDVTRPSVSIAMRRLRENGYITMDSDNEIDLTDKGRQIAERIYERHMLFTDWLIAIGVTPEVAHEDACRMEHAISEETFDAIKPLAQADIDKAKLSK